MDQTTRLPERSGIPANEAAPRIRAVVFWPPFALLGVAVVSSFFNLEGFLTTTSRINDWILTHFSWLFSLSALLLLLTLVWVYFSPIASVRLGGEQAQPLLSRWRWFAITLCTTIATGILFWGTAEPMFHLHAPPQSLELASGSPEAARFALSTLFLHWSFTPYAIYTVPALTFALVYYNLNKPFSLGSALSPVLGSWTQGRGGQVVDAIALYALVAGMSASLGAGVLTLSGGLDNLFGIGSGPSTRALVTTLIVATFIISAVSGLHRGISRLSNINIRLFFGYCLFVFLFGPTLFILEVGVESFGEYLSEFFSRSLYTGAAAADPWPKSWTIFYWANWFAWAPITAMFLGKIARGYTVREFIQVNMVLPALFACVWMSVFGGTALQMDISENGALYQVLQTKGGEAVIYAIFDRLPLAGITVAVFVFITFLSYVTAADSNTEAMSQLCTRSSPNEPELNESRSVRLRLKFAWGVAIGIVAWVMVSFANIDGIRMMSNLGGLPAMFIILIINFALIKLVRQFSHNSSQNSSQNNLSPRQ
ncbi:BCCT family transporter [Exilibacterium tricleocarpae]|uniref:BCCT family transporter n=1 Tax=Exilibacterium tricleocarpae TaxID=2591008 RepID=A0A545T1P8_9GAMM|nr:BCCT family transporter [Exilibacterium tricleocarpae]TQV71150.1 BCCT family transporter [Exilibacterium tricleocarpae]